jgi:hypothetical protein
MFGAKDEKHDFYLVRAGRGGLIDILGFRLIDNIRDSTDE